MAPPGGPIRCPEVVRRLDYEGELTIVIGAGGRIAGYCVADDVTARDLQGREPQWTRAKGADTFCPFGPWVTTADEVAGRRQSVAAHVGQRRAAPGLEHVRPDLRLRAARRASSRRRARCAPGDLILTGTPSGVGMGMDPPRFLESGDVVRIEIERLGSIEHPVA